MKSAQRLALIIIVAASCAAGVAAPMAQTATPALARLRASRNEIALSLSRPISRCIQRHDTDAPAFHGCIDWHSAVHATWALIAYGNLTHDDRYAPLVQSILTDQNIRLEMQSIKANPAFEMPYGRSWFLRLAIEYGAAYHDGRLIPMGDLVADTLLDRYQRQPPQVYSDAYQSDSWAMINLIDYFRYRGDTHKLAIVAQMVRHDFMGADSVACDPSLERPEFMAICTNVAWAVSMTADRPEFNAWIVKFLPVSAVAAPILAPRRTRTD